MKKILFGSIFISFVILNVLSFNTAAYGQGAPDVTTAERREAARLEAERAVPYVEPIPENCEELQDEPGHIGQECVSYTPGQIPACSGTVVGTSYDDPNPPHTHNYFQCCCTGGT